MYTLSPNSQAAIRNGCERGKALSPEGSVCARRHLVWEAQCAKRWAVLGAQVQESWWRDENQSVVRVRVSFVARVGFFLDRVSSVASIRGWSWPQLE